MPVPDMVANAISPRPPMIFIPRPDHKAGNDRPMTQAYLVQHFRSLDRSIFLSTIHVVFGDVSILAIIDFMILKLQKYNGSLNMTDNDDSTH